MSSFGLVLQIHQYSFCVLAGSSSDNTKLYLILALFILVGLVVFIMGFKTYREYRILEDTPEAPVRSIPMGLVHIHGKTTGENRLSSPLTHTPCYYYKVEVEKWVKKDKDHEGWEKAHTESDMRAFYLDDTTGQVLVDPAHAEFDVPRTFQGEIGFRAGSKRFLEATLGVSGPTEQDLRAYLAQSSQRAEQAFASLPVPGAKTVAKVLEIDRKLDSMGVHLSVGGLGLGGSGEQRYRFTEHCLIAEREYNITGTCAENPSPKDEHDRNLIKKGQNEPMFLISSKTEKELEKSLRRKAFLMILLGAAMMVGCTAIILAKLGMLK